MRLLPFLLLAFPVWAQTEMASLVRPSSLDVLRPEPLRFQPKPWFTFVDEPREAPPSQKFYRWSRASFVAGGAMAIARRPNAESAAFTAGIVGTSLLAERFMLRHHPHALCLAEFRRQRGYCFQSTLKILNS